jgi:polo-like kinase 4
MNHYEVGEQIGRGGFANVYSARDVRDGKQVALKIIRKELMQEELLFRVENEIRIHYQLKHSNIVQLYEYFQDDENIYLVLEYCSGKNLFQYLRHHQQLPENNAVHIIKQLLSALAYLHEHNIVHRDLKLSNILVVNQWTDNAANAEQQITVKLCDFGLAIQLKSTQEEHHTICGTPNFIAPEVALQQNHAFPADIWSIGCLFYTLLAGVPPFEHGNVQDTFGAIVRVEYQLEPLKHIVSPEGQQFLESLLQLVSTSYLLNVLLMLFDC